MRLWDSFTGVLFKALECVPKSRVAFCSFSPSDLLSVAYEMNEDAKDGKKDNLNFYRIRVYKTSRNCLYDYDMHTEVTLSHRNLFMCQFPRLNNYVASSDSSFESLILSGIKGGGEIFTEMWKIRRVRAAVDRFTSEYDCERKPSALLCTAFGKTRDICLSGTMDGNVICWDLGTNKEKIRQKVTSKGKEGKHNGL